MQTLYRYHTIHRQILGRGRGRVRGDGWKRGWVIEREQKGGVEFINLSYHFKRKIRQIKLIVFKSIRRRNIKTV